MFQIHAPNNNSCSTPDLNEEIQDIIDERTGYTLYPSIDTHISLYYALGVCETGENLKLTLHRSP